MSMNMHFLLPHLDFSHPIWAMSMMSMGKGSIKIWRWWKADIRGSQIPAWWPPIDGSYKHRYEWLKHVWKYIDVGTRKTIRFNQHVLCNKYFVLTINTMIRDSLYTKYIHKSVTILSQNVLSLNYRCIVHVYLNIRVFLLKSCKPIFSKTWRDRRKPKTSLHAACQIL